MTTRDFARMDERCRGWKFAVAKWSSCKCPEFVEGRPVAVGDNEALACPCPVLPDLGQYLTPKEKAERRKRKARR